jgi:hypothetical protein
MHRATVAIHDATTVKSGVSVATGYAVIELILNPMQRYAT